MKLLNLLSLWAELPIGDIVESSGVVNARQFHDGNPSNAIWTFNDSGGSAVLYRVNVSGHTEAKLTLTDAVNRDWESMARFKLKDQPYLVAGDVGDKFEEEKEMSALHRQRTSI